jgi:hypothetical protein
MPTALSRTVKITGNTGGFSLGELRDLIRETEHLHDDHRVSVTGGSLRNQFDATSATASVTWHETPR